VSDFILVGRGSNLNARMKKTNWAVAQVCLVVPCLMLCHLVLILVDAQDEGTIFVDQKEEDVKQIALSAGMLDGNCSNSSYPFLSIA
jgi:hypothetical protein